MKKQFQEELTPINKSISENQQINQKAKRTYVPFGFGKKYIQLSYILVFILTLYCIYTVYTVEQKLIEENKVYGIELGYFGYYKDVQDSQWKSLKGGFIELSIFAIVFLTLSTIVKKYSYEKNAQNNRIRFNILIGVGFSGYLFHCGLFYHLLEISLTYFLIKNTIQSKYFPHILWTSQIMILFINEKLDGFGFQWINNNQNSFWYTLDRDLHDASEVRWHVMYNLTVLKIISFGMDWYWSLNKIQKLDISKHDCQQCSNKEICYKVRQEQNQSPLNFTFSAYLGYLLYVPLLIAGPTTTFNAWISHIKKAQTTYNKKNICLYVLRTALIFLSFEIFIHISKSFAFLTNEKNKYLTSQISVPTLCIMSLAALMFIWYKFLSIWRFFRCWALLDGVETPENMNRCICNNYCFEGFWRSWHRSFNQWLIRYIFIPCGGSKYKQYNIWVVFTFVAFWHDINISLMVWAWVICLSLIPEIIVKAYFNQKKFDYIWGQYWFIFLCLLTGSFYITLMILANMIGFASGVQGTGGILDRLQTMDGFLGYLKFLFCLIPFTSLQFYIRDQEQKQSKNLKGM